MSKENKDTPITTMESFNVKAKSEEGIEMKLSLPDGTETEHYLVIRGSDSPTFKKALARNQRKQMELMKLQSNGKKKVDAGAMAMKQEKNQRELVATLVVGWSFAEDCTPEAVSKFFENSPQIQEQVDEVAAERRHFFNKPSNNSANTPKEVSG